MVFSWNDSRRAFTDAAEWFVGTTALVGDRWNRPGLGEWNIRALVGHTTRSLLTVEAYLAGPAAAADIASAADYFRATRAAAADPAVEARGREAGTALGTDPAAAVAEIAARVLSLVDDRAGTELVTTIAGGMRLGDYLPTRTFELAVHTADLATALGVPPDVPATAAAQALQIVTDLAVADGLAGPLLLAATRPAGPSGGLLRALTRVSCERAGWLHTETLSRQLAALADSVRLRLLSLLVAAEGAGSARAPWSSRSAGASRRVSHHVKVVC